MDILRRIKLELVAPNFPVTKYSTGYRINKEKGQIKWEWRDVIFYIDKKRREPKLKDRGLQKTSLVFSIKIGEIKGD